MTAHPTKEEPGVCPSQLDLTTVEKDNPVHIPDDYANVPFEEEWSGEIKLTPIGIVHKPCGQFSVIL